MSYRECMNQLHDYINEHDLQHDDLIVRLMYKFDGDPVWMYSNELLIKRDACHEHEWASGNCFMESWYGRFDEVRLYGVVKLEDADVPAITPHERMKEQSKECLEYLFAKEPSTISSVELVRIYGTLRTLDNLIAGDSILHTCMIENCNDFIDRIIHRIQSIEFEILKRMGV